MNFVLTKDQQFVKEVYKKVSREQLQERIELDCRTCENCTGYSCKLYGADADKAVKACAENFFRSYKEKTTPQPYKESE